MKKAILLLLALVMCFSCFAGLVSCKPDNGNGGDDTHTCVDANGDGKCDFCGKDMGKKDNPDDPDNPDDGSGKPWEKTLLRVQMTKSSNDQELPSGCERYMAGEDPDATESLDDQVAARNAAAEKWANVEISYDYYPDSKQYGWGANIDTICTTVLSNDPNRPDIYCNFITDSVGASLRGAFANLYSTLRGTGEMKGLNYFQFTDKDYDEETNNLGYMYDYMTTLTLSKFKMYILASDYCIDMVRSFLVVPVNVKMLNSIVGSIEEDRNGDGVINLDDFYEMVKNREWTYTKLAEYCDKIYQNAEGNTGASTIDDEQIGFALSTWSGLPACGMVYTTSVVVIHREWDDTRDDYSYYYPEENQDLYNLCDALSTLMQTRGVVTVYKAEAYGANSIIAMRQRFATDHLLFGGVICVGSLEYDAYQEMKDGVGATDEDLANGNYGFGVVTVPLYRDNSDDRYLTQIHTLGKGLGISATTTKFAQCTAWLDYQSTHSTEILDEYYNYKLQYDVAGGTEGNVYMLQYIRSNVRTAFDKSFEDAISIFFKGVDNQIGQSTWAGMIMRSNFQMSNMRDRYKEIYPSKKNYLESLVKEYDKLPD